MLKILRVCIAIFFICIINLQAEEFTQSNQTTLGISDFYDVVPDVNNCYEGVLKESEKQKFLNRLNYVRALHGLPAVTYKYEYDIFTAKGALMCVANNQLNHQPPSTWYCYSSDGYTGTSTSNLYMAWGFTPSTEQSVDTWHIDNNVSSLGHRRWQIDPFLKTVSIGRVDGTPIGGSGITTAMAEKVINAESQDLSGVNIEYIAYPYQNYPPELVNKSWYLSFSVLADKTNKWKNNNSYINFSGATITMQTEDGTNVSVSSVSYDYNGYGLPNIIKWLASGLQNETKYIVNINNVVVNSQTKNYQYWFKLTTTPTDVDNQNSTPSSLINSKFTLSNNYPNPFSFKTTISYELFERSYVRLRIYNILGQHINTLIDSEQDKGLYSVEWYIDNQLRSGVYLYRLDVGNISETKKMLILK